MSDNNPYAAPADATTAAHEPQPWTDCLYGLFVFFIVSSGLWIVFGILISGAVLATYSVSDVSIVLAAAIPAVLVGGFAGIRMWSRLASIHQKKVLWKIEQQERLGEFLDY